MARNSNYNYPAYRAPKRRIERVQSIIADTLTTSVTEMVLHSAEDRKTLVRAIIQLDATLLSGASGYAIGLYVEPKGTSITNPDTSEDLDNDMSKTTLWQYNGVHTASSLETHHIFADLKSMRKIDPGDQITIRAKCNITSGTYIAGVVTLFFKE